MKLPLAPRMTFDALLFDVDGTLADTEELHRQAFNEAFRAHRLPWCWSPDSYSRLLQVTSPQNVESLVSATLGREALGFADQCRVGAAFLGLEQLARLHGSHLERTVGDALSDSGVGARFQELL